MHNKGTSALFLARTNAPNPSRASAAAECAPGCFRYLQIETKVPLATPDPPVDHVETDRWLRQVISNIRLEIGQHIHILVHTFPFIEPSDCRSVFRIACPFPYISRTRILADTQDFSCTVHGQLFPENPRGENACSVLRLVIRLTSSSYQNDFDRPRYFRFPLHSVHILASAPPCPMLPIEFTSTTSTQTCRRNWE